MLNTISLKQLSVHDGIDVYHMLQRIGPSEYGFNNEVNGMSFVEYKKWLIERDAWSRGEMLPDGYVKQWIYWLSVDERTVGYGKLREQPTEASRKFGGNIGYAIDPSERGKGYGNILFGLLLKQAAILNIHEIFSTVDKYNYSSKNVHEKHGGTLCSEDDFRWYYDFSISKCDWT